MLFCTRGDHLTHRRRELEPVPAPAQREVQALHSRARPHDRVPVRSHVVRARPAAHHLEPPGPGNVHPRRAHAVSYPAERRDHSRPRAPALLTGVGHRAECAPAIGSHHHVRDGIRTHRRRQRAPGSRRATATCSRRSSIGCPAPRGRSRSFAHAPVASTTVPAGTNPWSVSRPVTRPPSTRIALTRAAEVVLEPARGPRQTSPGTSSARRRIRRRARRPRRRSPQRELRLDRRSRPERGNGCPGRAAAAVDVVPAGRLEPFGHRQQVAASNVSRVGDADLVRPVDDRAVPAIASRAVTALE